MEGGTYFTKIVLRGLDALRASHAEARNHRLGVVEIVIADPGQGQISENFVAVGQTIKNDRVPRRRDAALMGQHDALRSACRSRGEKDDGWVRASPLVDRPIERGGDGAVGEGGPAGGDQLVK